jgi:hypothetical protein
MTCQEYAVENIISDVQTVSVGDLMPFPGNPRKGNIAAIAESLQANAQFSPLVVQTSTGYVLAGNHTLAAAISLGWETVSVVFVDVGEVEARKIVLASNRTADLGTYDKDILLDLLENVDDLIGTGYTADDVAKLDPYDAEGNAKDQSGDLDSSWAVVINCRDEAQQLDLISRFHAEGLECRSLVA